MTWIKIHCMPWLLGSTRWELTHEQRAIFIDLLVEAGLNEEPGQIEFLTIKQLAQHFAAPVGLIRSTLERCYKNKKIEFEINEIENKKIILILNWNKYQSEYLRQKPFRNKKKNRGAKVTSKVTVKVTNGVTKELQIEERRGEEKREEEKKGDKIVKSASLNNGLHSSTLNSNLTKKEQFLSLLKEVKEYSFDEYKDSILFDIVASKYPGINLLKQLSKKIKWWKDHPDALKKNPRKQLQDWFKEEAEFQKRGGPQQIGKIIGAGKDADHLRFLEEMFKK